MKPLLSVLAFLALTSTAFANLSTGEVRQFKIEKFKFAASHAKNPQSGFITIDEAARTVKMEVQPEMPACPIGKYCIQVMPLRVVVELPITSIETDSCGILKVVAQEDLTPADGLLREIRIEDSSEMTCKTFVAVPSKATYKTSFYNRMNGKLVKQTSKMELERIQDKSSEYETFNLEEGKFLTGFPQIEEPAAGVLEISKNELTLNVSINLNCGSGPCPAYMPHPIQVTLPIVKRTGGTCGERITAHQEVRTHYGLSITTIEVVDFRAAICEIYVKHPIQVSYSNKDVFSGGSKEQTAIFHFNK